MLQSTAPINRTPGRISTPFCRLPVSVGNGAHQRRRTEIAEEMDDEGAERNALARK